MGRVFADITPLKVVPAYRRYLLGMLVSLIGSALTVVAMRYQAYKLGGDSTLAVSFLAVVTLVPLLVSSVFGGSLADMLDRRKILLVTQVSLGLCSLGLSLNAMSAKPKLWVLYVLAALSSGIVGIDWPTRTSIVPNLVGPQYTAQAIALNISLFNIAGIASPLVAGFLVKHHLAGMYLFDAISYGATFIVAFTLPPQKPASGKGRVTLSTVADGFRYVRGQRTIQSTFAADIGAMIFGLPDALYPAMAEKVFGNTYWLGFLQAAPAMGALVASATSGWTQRVRRQGRAVIWCIVSWGLGIALFGATRWIAVALVGLFVAGAADAISAVFRSTIVQVEVPDEYRGRLSAIFIAVVRGGPRLGEFESGLAASLGGLQFAAVSGGLACIVWIAVVAKRYPELGSYVPERLREPVAD